MKIILAPDMDATKTYSGTLKKKDNVEETLNLIKSTNALPLNIKLWEIVYFCLQRNR